MAELKKYPISLYKSDGNLMERVAHDADDEKRYREQGFLLLEELYPEPKKGKKS